MLHSAATSLVVTIIIAIANAILVTSVWRALFASVIEPAVQRPSSTRLVFPRWSHRTLSVEAETTANFVLRRVQLCVCRP